MSIILRCILICYFFLLTIFVKKFTYIHATVHGFPLYISDLTLLLSFAFAIPLMRDRWHSLNRKSVYFFALFFLYGFIRLGTSIFSGAATEFGLQKVLKDYALFYQSIWCLLPILLSVAALDQIFLSTIYGGAVAQILAWLAFYYFGYRSGVHLKFIGFPPGNETTNPLYPFILTYFSSISAFFTFFLYAGLWVTQFFVYLKRFWAAMVLFFSLPIVLWIVGKKGKKQIFLSIIATILGFVFFYAILNVVSQRTRPIYILSNDTNSFHLLAAATVPDQDDMQFQPNLERQLFHGENNASMPGAFGYMAFRGHLWMQAWRGFLEKPVWGQGFGPLIVKTQVNGSPAMWEGKWISGPHNSFLAILYRGGLAAFFAFTLALFFLLKDWWMIQNKQNSHYIALANFILMILFTAFNVCLENPQGGIWFWWSCGWLLSQSANAQKTLPK